MRNEFAKTITELALKKGYCIIGEILETSYLMILKK